MEPLGGAAKADLAQQVSVPETAQTGLGGLTDYQMLNGCLEEVQARDEGELWLLCDAQTRLAERVALAESVRRRP